MQLGEGSQIGRRYRLISQIGRGGMGKVWLAHDDLLHREIAVKEVLFPPGLSTSDREVLYERTLREARSAARLSHRGIVTVHDVVEEDGRPWIVMEYVRARSLQQVIDESGRMPAPLVADIGAQVLDALRGAHAAGVLHRDVKPANILLDTQDAGAPRAVITDFGIARVEGDTTLTQTGLVLGSPAYIAPERALGEEATAASDVWALGATLYAAVEGRAPHDRPEAMAALNAVLTQEAPPPKHAGPLAPLLMGMLAKDPSQRVTSERAAEDLARITRAVPVLENDATMQDVPDDRTMIDQATHAAGPWADQSGPYGPHGTEAIAPVHERFGPGPTGHLPRPSAYAPPKKGRAGKVFGLVAVLLVLVVAISLLLHRVRHRNDAAAGPSSPASPTTSSQSPPTSASPSPTATTPAPRLSAGPEGSALAVPDGWTRQVVGGSSVKWTQKATGATIQVDSIPWGMSDPVAHWKRFQNEVIARNRLPGYQRIQLTGEYAARGWPASDLEYTWRSSSYGTMRAYDRGFTANGHQYAVLVAAPAARWSRYSGLVDSLFAAFRPAP